MHTPDFIQRRDTTRALLRSYVETYTLSHANEFNERLKATIAGKERRSVVVPPLAIEVTVGIGKSHSVSQVIVPMINGAGMPVLILAPTRQLCHEYEVAIKATGIDCTLYQPRHDTKPGKPSNPFSCYQVKQIDKAGNRHQRPAQSICRQCPNGYKAALESENTKSHERAVQWFSRNGYSEREIGEIPRCRYLYEGLPEQLKAEVLIAPASAFSEALATLKQFHVDSNGRDVMRTVQRLIIVDERFDMTETIKITPPHVDGWMSAIDRTLKNLVSESDREKRLALEQVQAAIGALGARLIQRQDIDDDTRDLIQQAYQSINDVDLIDGGTASFERVSFMPDDEDFFIPLRAFAALARALKTGTDETNGSLISVAVTKPLVEWSIRRGSTIMLDATLDSTLRELIETKGGSILSAQAPQNIKVTRVTGRMFARGANKSKKYQAEAERAMRHLGAIAEDMPKPAAIITHKSYLDYATENEADAVAAAFEAATGVKIGWYGKHDRGHNAWSGRHIALVGMQIFSKETVVGLWQERRALMRLINREIEPLADEPSDGPYIPADPTAQAWLFDIYAATLVQAIGRARGINHEHDEPLEIRLYGGLIDPGMDAALARHLITISRKVAYGETVHVQRSNDPRERIRAAINEVARGRKGAAGVSRRSVETWLMRASKKGVKHDVVDEEIRRWKAELETKNQ